MKTLFGLPAHPLFVHVPIVLIPLASIGVVAMAVSARARARFGWLTIGIAVVAGISTQFAVTSGQALQDSVRHSAALREHTRIAESIRPLILLLFLVGLALMLIHCRATGAWPFPRQGRSGPAVPRAVIVVIGVAALVSAAAADVRLAQIGHNGAKATWERTRVRDGGGEGLPSR